MDSELMLGRRVVVSVIAVTAVLQAADVATALMRNRPADWLGAVITVVLCVFLYRGANWARWATVALEAVLAALILTGAALEAAVVADPSFSTPNDIFQLAPIVLPWGQSTVHALLPYHAIFLVALGMVHAGCAIVLAVPSLVRAYFRRSPASA